MGRSNTLTKHKESASVCLFINHDRIQGIITNLHKNHSPEPE